MSLQLSPNCPHDVSEQDVAAQADGLCPLCLQAKVVELMAERDEANTRAAEQTALATKSIRRLAEKTEPGEIGAFTSRDHWQGRALAAESALAKALEVVAGLLIEWDRVTQYGSPMAKAANPRVFAARDLIRTTEHRHAGE